MEKIAKAERIKEKKEGTKAAGRRPVWKATKEGA
jgi:hypothetical protein